MSTPAMVRSDYPRQVDGTGIANLITRASQQCFRSIVLAQPQKGSCDDYPPPRDQRSADRRAHPDRQREKSLADGQEVNRDEMRGLRVP